MNTAREISKITLWPLDLRVKPEGRDGYSVMNGHGEIVMKATPSRSTAEKFIAGSVYTLNQLAWTLATAEEALRPRAINPRDRNQTKADEFVEAVDIARELNGE